MPNKTLNEFFIPREESFGLGLFDSDTDGSLGKIQSALNRPRFTVGETHVSYRVMNHWQAEGLLPEGVEDQNGWKRFTRIEFIWLRIIHRLRGFGLSLQKIARVKKGVLDWDEKERRYPDFEYDVLKALLTGSDPHICILKDGRARIGTLAQLTVAKKMYGNFDVLLISLKSVIEETGLPVTETSTLISLSDAETDLISTVRLEDSNEVNIKISPYKEIMEIESTVTTKKPETARSAIKHIEAEGLYGELTTKFVNGKKQSTTIRKRKRI